MCILRIEEEKACKYNAHFNNEIEFYVLYIYIHIQKFEHIKNDRKSEKMGGGFEKNINFSFFVFFFVVAKKDDTVIELNLIFDCAN